jgi:hypothetical protein
MIHAWPVDARPVVAVMILYAQDRKVFVNGVRRVFVDMMEMKADALPLADTTAVRVCDQNALSLCFVWFDAIHAT